MATGEDALPSYRLKKPRGGRSARNNSTKSSSNSRDATFGLKSSEEDGEDVVIKASPNQVHDHLTFAYDFECRVEGPHEPNFVAVQCLEMENISVTFQGTGCAQQFCAWIFASCVNCIFLGHNAGRYDSILLCNALEKQGRWVKKLQNGSNIIMMEIRQLNVKFIDSFSFLPRPLRCLPKDFDIAEEKGHFPFLFNTLANESYVGPLPSKEFYNYERMDEREKAAFDQWFEPERIAVGNNWNLMERLGFYCIQDVNVLAKCLRVVRTELLEITGLDVFKFPTSASSCITALQYRFLPPKSVGIVPMGGYGGKGNVSRKSLEWLAYVRETESLEIQTMRSAAGEHRLQGTRITLDGWCAEKEIAFNFHGT